MQAVTDIWDKARETTVGFVGYTIDRAQKLGSFVVTTYIVERITSAKANAAATRALEDGDLSDDSDSAPPLADITKLIGFNLLSCQHLPEIGFSIRLGTGREFFLNTEGLKKTFDASLHQLQGDGSPSTVITKTELDFRSKQVSFDAIFKVLFRMIKNDLGRLHSLQIWGYDRDGIEQCNTFNQFDSENLDTAIRTIFGTVEKEINRLYPSSGHKENFFRIALVMYHLSQNVFGPLIGPMNDFALLAERKGLARYLPPEKTAKITIKFPPKRDIIQKARIGLSGELYKGYGPPSVEGGSRASYPEFEIVGKVNIRSVLARFPLPLAQVRIEIKNRLSTYSRDPLEDLGEFVAMSDMPDTLTHYPCEGSGSGGACGGGSGGGEIVSMVKPIPIEATELGAFERSVSINSKVINAFLTPIITDKINRMSPRTVHNLAIQKLRASLPKISLTIHKHLTEKGGIETWKVKRPRANVQKLAIAIHDTIYAWLQASGYNPRILHLNLFELTHYITEGVFGSTDIERSVNEYAQTYLKGARKIVEYYPDHTDRMQISLVLPLFDLPQITAIFKGHYGPAYAKGEGPPCPSHSHEIVATSCFAGILTSEPSVRTTIQMRKISSFEGRDAPRSVFALSDRALVELANSGFSGYRPRRPLAAIKDAGDDLAREGESKETPLSEGDAEEVDPVKPGDDLAPIYEFSGEEESSGAQESGAGHPKEEAAFPDSSELGEVKSDNPGAPRDDGGIVASRDRLYAGIRAKLAARGYSWREPEKTSRPSSTAPLAKPKNQQGKTAPEFKPIRLERDPHSIEEGPSDGKASVVAREKSQKDKEASASETKSDAPSESDESRGEGILASMLDALPDTPSGRTAGDDK